MYKMQLPCAAKISRTTHARKIYQNLILPSARHRSTQTSWGKTRSCHLKASVGIRCLFSDAFGEVDGLPQRIVSS